MAGYTGSCHCGKVRFRITAELDELITCDCSLCRKKNAVMARVHESRFELLAGQDALALYQWNTGTAEHYFCAACGIYTFHRRRTDPRSYAVNAFCLDDADLERLPVRATDGKSLSVDD